MVADLMERARTRDEYPEAVQLPRRLRPDSKRRGERTGDRGQQETAALHAETVGRRGSEGQEMCFLRSARVSRPATCAFIRRFKGRAGESRYREVLILAEALKDMRVVVDERHQRRAPP
jgi:hypothetical protein